MNRLRANTLKDYGNFSLHFGLASTVSAGAFIALGMPPVLGAIALGTTAALHFGLAPVLREKFQDAIDDEKAESLKKKSEDLLVPSKNRRDHYALEKSHDLKFRDKVESWIGEFSDRFGIKKRDRPDLLIMPPPSPLDKYKLEDGDLKDSLRHFLKTKFNEKANAFAFSHNHGNVVLNNPIVNALDDKEIKGVVAHEMAHLAAGHTGFQKILSYVSTPAKILTALNALVTTFSSIKNFGLVYAAHAVSNIVAKGVSTYQGWDEEDDKDKAKIKSLKSYVGTAGIIGLGLFFHAPDLVLAQAINFATNRSLFLIEKSQSRRHEFQADRLAGELTKDPESLSSGLEKIRDLHKEPDFSPKKKPKGMLSGIFERVSDLSKTHPNIGRRCERLRDMVLERFAFTPSLN